MPVISLLNPSLIRKNVPIYYWVDSENLPVVVYIFLYNVAVIQWITSCQKNRMTTPLITLWRVNVINKVHVNNTYSY